MKVGVVGGGVAGTAAAWAARRAGADVVLTFERPGASSLYAGALDLSPWDEALDARLDSDVLAFATALEAWSVGTQSARIATHEGVLRPARGIDSCLLDLSRLAGATIGVVEAPIDGWNAQALARSLSQAPWAMATRTRFEAVPVDGIVDQPETRAPWFDLARLHDHPERAARLAERLSGTSRAVDAWLFGAFIGTTPGAAERLSALVGKPCGETTSPPGGPAGARFEASRDTLLASLGVSVRRERIDSVTPRGARIKLVGASPESTDADTGFDAVVLATGGLVGGGIVLDPGDLVAQPPRFRSCVGADLLLGRGGRVLDHVSSLHGLDLPALGMGALEEVGILSDGPVARGDSGLLVAGDCVADRPRCALEAARAGIAAARKATTRP